MQVSPGTDIDCLNTNKVGGEGCLPLISIQLDCSSHMPISSQNFEAIGAILVLQVQRALRVWSTYVAIDVAMVSINRKSCGGHLGTPNS